MLTVAQVAKKKRVSERAVRAAIVRGALKARRFGARAWVVEPADAEQWKPVGAGKYRRQ